MNFEFISSIDSLKQLYVFCEKAEKQVYNDPSSSAVASRNALSVLVTYLFNKCTGEDGRDLTVFDMLTDNRFRVYIKDPVFIDSLHSIRKMGNEAAHAGNITEEKAMEILRQLYFVVAELCIREKLISDYPDFKEPPEDYSSDENIEDITERINDLAEAREKVDRWISEKDKETSTRNDTIYNEAVSDFEADTELSLSSAKKLFLGISGWKDSDEYAARADIRLEELREESEKKKQAASKKKKLFISIAAVIVLLIAVSAFVSVNHASVNSLIESANNGDPEAQLELADSYLKGSIGIKQDYYQAYRFYLLSASQGNSDAQKMVGYCHENGIGTIQDVNEAIKWYTVSMEQGNNEAEAKLEELNRKLFENAMAVAESGDAAVQADIGLFYEEGRGVEQNSEEAFKWFEKAAVQGNASAQNNLGILYQIGRGTEKDPKKAVFWYERAAEQGLDVAQLNLGYCYEIGEGAEQNYSEAAKMYKLAADQSNAQAQYNLGHLYEDGNGVEQDYTEALKWYTRAAEGGLPAAQVSVGNYFVQGLGTLPDNEKAAKWYKLAAGQGDSMGQFQLATQYVLGEGIEQDFSKGVELYILSAEQGNDLAQYSLGECYYNGVGVPTDIEKAIYWFQKAAEQGNNTAIARLEELGLTQNTP